MNQTSLLDRNPTESASSRRRVGGAPLIAIGLVAVLIVVGFSSMVRPSAAGVDAPFAEFSAARANTHIQAIAVEPHPMGSEAIRRTESYLTDQLTGMGLDPHVQEIDTPDYFGAPGDRTTVRNIVATIPGTASSKAIVLIAHYDTHPETPGANDNSAGVAVLLETARATLAGDRPSNDIVLLFTDAEEPYPRYGANGFVAQYRSFENIGLVVNLEAIGSSGPSLLGESSRPETGIVDRYRSFARDPGAFSFFTEMVDLFGGVGTDFDVFKARQVPGLSFAYLRGSSIYHTDRDVPATIELKTIQHHGDNVMAVIEAFGDTELPLSTTGSDIVFFSLTPVLSVGYSMTVAALLASLAVGAFGVSAWRRLRSKRDSIGGILRGSMVLLAGSVASALAVFAAWWALTSIRTTPGIWESYLYLALLIVLAAVVLSFVGGALAGPLADAELATGIVAVWVVLGVVTTIMLPGFSYLFIWPALGGVVALAGSSSGRLRDWLWLVVAAPAVVLAIPALDAFFQMAQPRPGNPDSSLTVTVTLVGFLAALLIGLVVPFRPGARRGS